VTLPRELGKPRQLQILKSRARFRVARLRRAKARDEFQIRHERGKLSFTLLRLSAQDCRGMDGGRYGFRKPGFDELATVLRHPELPAEQRLCRRRAEEDEDARLHDLELGLEPGAAGGHLGPVRLLMDPAFASRLPLEVLDGVRDVGRRAVDSRGGERFVE
jgi:hypothetical protein